MKINLVKNGIFPIKYDLQGNLLNVDTGYNISGTIQGEGKLMGMPCIFIRLSGCNLNCIWLNSNGEGSPCDTPYCVEKGTLVRMYDNTERKIEDIIVGDIVIGYDTKRGVYVPSTVIDTMIFKNEGKRKISLSDTDNNKIVCTENHKFLNSGPISGTKYTKIIELKNNLNRRLMTLPLEDKYIISDNILYDKGYIAGLLESDGSFWISRKEETIGIDLVDYDAMKYFRDALIRLNLKGNNYDNKTTKIGTKCYTTRINKKEDIRLIKEMLPKNINKNDYNDFDYVCGYMSGFFDGDGGNQYVTSKFGDKLNHQVMFYQKTDQVKIDRILEFLKFLKIDHLFKTKIGKDGTVAYISNGGFNSLQEIYKYLSPKIERKKLYSFFRKGRGITKYTKINEIIIDDAETLPEVYDISTTTENFIANNFIVHNSSFKAEKNMMEIDDIIKLINLNNPNKIIKHVVVSGGEPTLQHKPLAVLLQQLQLNGYHTTIETNGTIYTEEISKYTNLVSISPKLFNSVPSKDKFIGNEVDKLGLLYIEKWEQTHNKKRINIEALQQYIDDCYFIDEADDNILIKKQKKDYQLKFVVSTEEDLKEIIEIKNQLHIQDTFDITLMPEGYFANDIMQKSKWVIEKCIENGFRFTTRLHTLIFGTSRGI